MSESTSRKYFGEKFGKRKRRGKAKLGVIRKLRKGEGTVRKTKDALLKTPSYMKGEIGRDRGNPNPQRLFRWEPSG